MEGHTIYLGNVLINGGRNIEARKIKLTVRQDLGRVMLIAGFPGTSRTSVPPDKAIEEDDANVILVENLLQIIG